MSGNIFDYLKWRGDLTFEHSPFNIVDNLILSELSYADLSSCSSSSPRSLSDIAETIYIPDNESSQAHIAGILAGNMASTERYSRLMISDFVNFTDHENTVQMSAVTFTLPDKRQYIAFRGTDDTLTGWKEDFYFSFSDETDGQKIAVQYLNNILSKSAADSYVGGHSKGGNLAVFAAINCNHKDNIINIFSNDGPGFRDGVKESEEFLEIESKIISVIPEDSVIGRLMNGLDDSIVVKSNQSGIMQHDPTSWQLIGTEFIKSDRSDFSEFAEKTVDGWIEGVDDERRQFFVDSLFSFFAATGKDSFFEMRENKLKNAAAIVKAFTALDKSKRVEFIKLVNKLIKSGSDVFSKEIKNTLSKKES